MTPAWTTPARTMHGLTLGFEDRALHFAPDLAFLSDGQVAILAGHEAGCPEYVARSAARYCAAISAMRNAR